ncbi:sigma-70 family RNA polymerase sigma factor [Sphingosinicella sp.]|uniref:sigma-70 family RNA polymerase sigma factor n=1 Tax=Sphingosinicella sp. TaxID=1917971 RepID=UPI00403775EB
MMRARASGMDLVVRPARVEASLWRRLRFEAEPECRETLFNRYVALARLLARRQSRRHATLRADRGELEQFAFEALLQAIDRYDPLRGIPFIAFARRRILGAIADGIARLSEVGAQLRVRRRLEQERLRSLAAAEAEAAVQDDALARLSELAMGLALGIMLEGTGLYSDEDEIDPAPSPYESLEWRQLHARLGQEVERLPPKEAAVVRQHYNHGLSFAQIARLLELSRGRVSQLHNAALGRLRKRIGGWG